jgi:hypothetical protein
MSRVFAKLMKMGGFRRASQSRRTSRARPHKIKMHKKHSLRFTAAYRRHLDKSKEVQFHRAVAWAKGKVARHKSIYGHQKSRFYNI